MDSASSDIPPSSILPEASSGFLEGFWRSPDPGDWMGIALAIVFGLLCSALISGSEVALFSLQRTQLDKIKNTPGRSSRIISQLMTNPRRLLATILVANNFVNIVVVILFSYLNFQLFNMTAHPTAGFLLEVIGVTFILVLSGEIVPKVYAHEHAEKFARGTAWLIEILGKLFWPLTSILVSSTNFLDKKLKGKGHELNREDLDQAIELTSREKDKLAGEESILKGIVNFGNIPVKQIMKPRMDIVAIEFSHSYEQVVDLIKSSGYSRFPVYQENLDRMVGILTAKDLMELEVKQADAPWTQAIRKAFFVPEGKKIDSLLREFQQRRLHMALVVDEYGGTSGLVTLEDVMEEILGEMDDEMDDSGPMGHTRIDAETYLIDAKLPINDLYRLMDLEDQPFEEVREDSDTVGGLILELCGKIPVQGHTVRAAGFEFTVESVGKRRINRVKVRKMKPHGGNEA